MSKENLRSFNKIPKEEHIEISRRGGINSGRKRRFRKLMANVVDIWIQDTIRSLDKEMNELTCCDNFEHYGDTMGHLSAMTEPEQMDLFEALEEELNAILSDDEAPEA